MTWNGLLLDSTQVNLNLHIDLDYEESVSDCEITE